MNHWKLSLGLILATMTLGIALQFWYWPQLPDRMAIHFDSQGRANDWMSKTPATLLSAGLVIGLPLLFIGISQIVRRLPPSMINIPHREYWLAPEQRGETLQWMTGFMMWFSVAIALFTVGINHLTFLANRDSESLLIIPFVVLLGAFLLTTFVLIVFMLRRFPNPNRIEK